MRMFSRFAGLAVLMGLFVVPTAEARTRVYVRIAPPPIVLEHVTVAPRANFVWVAGHHRWNGRHYVWVRGRWVRPPHRHARWVEGRWVHERRGHYWQEGRWTR
jgi:WXXGXW repeat (2 copies)